MKVTAYYIAMCGRSKVSIYVSTMVLPRYTMVVAVSSLYPVTLVDSYSNIHCH